ncbi:MAG TPA: lysophospholipid acyltransferase family protein [Sphingobacteriaceae bacterium]
MVFLRLLSYLPFPVLYLISDFLFFVSYRVVRYRKKVIRRNLKNSFPDKSEKELRQIEKNFYRHLCDYGVETLKLLTISKAELTKRMQFANTELLAKFKANNQSIFFLASHQFNWEWMLVSASLVFPFDIEFVYQPVKNKFFDRFSLATRSRFGALGIRRKDVAREIIKRRNKLKGLASVADQYPGYDSDKKYATRFLNQDTVFFYGTNQLAQLTQFPTLYYKVEKVRRGYYLSTPVIIGEPPYDKTSDAVIEGYVRELEKSIQQNPANYLWSHNRWKKRHLRAET